LKTIEQEIHTISPENLPPRWAVATISEMIAAEGVFSDGDWVVSKDQDPHGDVRLVQLADIGDGVWLDKSSKYLYHDKAIELRCTFLEAGDVLIARMPDPLGRACLFPGDPKQCVTAVDVCIVRTANNGVSHRWLMHTVNSPAVRVAVESLQSGSTRKRISRKNLGRLVLPLPPSKQQRRIVEAIETQFTRLDAAVASLERAQANLKRYRASVLKAACEGRLVPTEAELARAEGRDYEQADQLLQRILAERRAKWEKEHTGKKYKEPAPPDTTDLPEPPEGWVWAAFGQVARIASDLVDPTTTPDAYHVAPNHIESETGRLLPYGTVANDGVTSPKHRFHSGQILYSKIRPYLAKAVVSSIDGVCSADMYPVDSFVNTRFLHGYMISAEFTAAVSRHQGRTVLPKINRAALSRLPVPVPPIDEQNRIADEVDRQLSLIDALEREVEAGLARGASLRQSILKRAFEGRLVEQDPNDEPASVLLERIKAQRKGT
jgi:type I restriction enzyme S subunit